MRIRRQSTGLAAGLPRIKVAFSCPVLWQSMTGTDRVRHCDECSQNVYNLYNLGDVVAADLLSATEGRVCKVLYQRADGTILTRNCSIGWRIVRRHWVRRLVAAAVLLLAALGAKGWSESLRQALGVTYNVGV